MLITTNFLKKHLIKKSDINWYQRNFKIPLEPKKIEIFYYLYSSHFDWFKNIFKCKFEYNNNGYIIKKIIYNNYKFLHQYDEQYVIQFEYDDRKNCIKEIHNNQHILYYEYDNKNNRIKEILPNTVIIQNKYDNRNNRIKKIYSNDYMTLITHYKYDDRNNRIKIIDSDGDITHFEYDERNNCIKEIWPCGLLTKYEYKYNAQKNLIKLYEDNTLYFKIKYGELK